LLLIQIANVVRYFNCDSASAVYSEWESGKARDGLGCKPSGHRFEIRQGSWGGGVPVYKPDIAARRDWGWRLVRAVPRPQSDTGCSYLALLS